MELHVCHLYPDLLNLYGDIGNIMVLKYRAEKRGISVFVHNHSVGDDFDPELYDIIMVGGGQDFEMRIVSADLEGQKKELLRQYIENDGVLLAICGGFQMLGDYYLTPQGEKINGLGILPFYTKGEEKRLIGDIAISFDDYPVIGFENHAGRTYIGNLSPLGKVLHGFGNNAEDGGEGLHYKSTYCTYLHGPLLSKNPKLTDTLLLEALRKKYNIDKLEPLDDSLEEEARKVMLSRMQLLSI